MRGRLRELAGSLGLVDTQEDTAPADEPVGEELYVMPGWAVAKLRDASQQDRNPPNDTGEPPLGESHVFIYLLISQFHSIFMCRYQATAL